MQVKLVYVATPVVAEAAELAAVLLLDRLLFERAGDSAN